VRLVSFAASVVLAAVVLLGLASMRYTPLWRQDDAPRIAVVSEVRRDPFTPSREQPTPPRTPQREAESQEQAAPQLPPAPAAPSEPVVITSPTWIERPRNPERYYPRDAFMRGIAGEVELDCDVDVAGRLSCVVASETPEGQGFGDAALRIAGAHVMRPAMQDGAPVRGRYRMVVPFSPGG
jgi:protein TonB